MALNITVPTANLIKEAHQLKLMSSTFGEKNKTTFLGVHYAGGEDLKRLAGESSNGFYWATSLISPDIESEGKDYVTKIIQNANSEAKYISSSDYHTGVINAQLVVEAFRRAKQTSKKDGKPISRAMVLEALENMNGANKFSPLNIIDGVEFTTKDHSALHKVVIYKMQNQRFEH